MLTELWAPGLLGYLSHSRKLTAARKEFFTKAYTALSAASQPVGTKYTTGTIPFCFVFPFVSFVLSSLFLLLISTGLKSLLLVGTS